MKRFALAAVALIAFTTVIGYSTVGNGGETKKVNPKKAEPQADQLPLAQVQSGFKPFKVEKKGLVVGEVIQSGIGKVVIYDNGKGYRWAEQTEVPFVYTYNNGGTQKIYMERQDGNPVNVTTKRYGVVYADPRLLVNLD
jgi:hypothetical protein